MSSTAKKRRGLSNDEKRSRTVKFLQNKDECFQLKDLEKLLSKYEGINSMKVKEILKSLVDDDMIESDKVGMSNYFWCFKAKKVEKLITLKEKYTKSIEEKECELKNISEKIDSKKNLCQDSENRTDILTNLGKNNEKLEEITKEINTYEKNDPGKINALKQENAEKVTEINNTTDNIFALVSWSTKKFGFLSKDMYKNFAIPTDLDYVE
ncbi:Meiotic nuclear division protein 1 [Intoshia linei]|uniref:Meiotic nuclear division protein 1 homolog n=1 Tax=Intoshia linei TaxID=1819745 RepID=A0A177BBV3_9BILA|nr:Meiotic nuclear division protein 1 [Intoshia linei]